MIINRLRAVAREFISLPPCLTVFCAVFFASLISMPAAAQDTQATPTSTIQTQDIVSRPIPERTSGLAPGKIVRWTRKDAILAALEKNVDIELERERVRMTQYGLIATQGFYDPMTTSTILYNRASSPNAQRFSGTDANAISNQSLTYNFGANKYLEWGGGLVSANFNNTRSVSNTSNLSTLYSPSLTFRLTQPMFKGFGIDETRYQIKVAKKTLDLNDAQFRAMVIQIISQVEQAYWTLSLAIRNEKVQRESVGVAETLLNNTKRQVEVGTLAPIEVVSAATSLESRRVSVFQAINSVGQAENALKNLTAGGQTDELWSSVIEPVDPFEIKATSIPVDDAIKLAQENRPEIRQQNLNKEINKIGIDFFRNQAKPQIDLIANYSTNGLGGTPAVTSGTAPNCSTAPVLRVAGDPNSGLVCNEFVVGRDAAGNFIPTVNTFPFDPAVPFTQTSQITNQFIGGYGTALSNLFKNEFRTWSVGVAFSLPLRNRTAKANLGKALETERQLDLQMRQTMQNIEVDVRNAVQAVETAKMRIDAAQAAERYARLQLEGEEKKFQAGLQSTFFVLDRQNQLSVAQLSTLQAQADYNIAISNLQRVIATTLSSNSIELKQDTPVTIK
jgi:HAE1 family hydrophobic/amphiphilic exporter-1